MVLVAVTSLLFVAVMLHANLGPDPDGGDGRARHRPRPLPAAARPEGLSDAPCGLIASRQAPRRSGGPGYHGDPANERDQVPVGPLDDSTDIEWRWSDRRRIYESAVTYVPLDGENPQRTPGSYTGTT